MTSALWDAEASREEEDRTDEQVNRALRWREIERRLDGVETIVDVGGGTGAFSIPLAKRGFRVTHLDVSAEMLARARANAEAAGVAGIEFVQGDARDWLASGASLAAEPAPPRGADARRFDLVLALDGAISFAGAGARDVLAACVRATARTLIVTVSNRASMVATWLKYGLNGTGRIPPAVGEMLRTGSWDAHASENDGLYPQPYRFPALKAFTRAELVAALEAHGLRVLLARSLGSLTHLMLPHGLRPDLTPEYLDLCEAYDLAFPDGPGSFRRAGLMAVASQT